MKLLRGFGRWLLWIVEEFDRNMNYSREGLGLLGTVPPDRREKL
jgi:hypothetical protein